MKALLLMPKPKGMPMKGMPKGGAAEEKVEGGGMSEKTEGESGSGAPEEKFARLAVQAIAAGDEDAAVDSLVEAIRACVKSNDEGDY